MNRPHRLDVNTGAATDAIPSTTRRAVLAAGGALTLGTLAGCVSLDGAIDRIGQEAVGTTGASPAGFYAGDPSAGNVGESVDVFATSAVNVRYVPPSIRVESQRIDIDGWSTSTTTKAQDYNSSRSNKPSTIWVPDLDTDDDGDGLPTLVAALDTERALVVYADAALAAVEDRASDDATGTLDAFINATTKARRGLERCGTDRCRGVSETLTTQQELAEDARDAVDTGEWERAGKSLQEARRIAGGNLTSLIDAEDFPDWPADPDSDDDGILDAAAPLYDYLDREPTVAEHFVVSLPDARVRGGSPSLAEEITPRRVLDYFMGQKNAESCDASEGRVAVHRALSCRDLLTARLEEEAKKQRHVAAFELSGGVVVTGATPDADVSAPMLQVAPNNAVSLGGSLTSWGEEATASGVTISSTLVCPAVATPPDCPCPMPVLFHVRRIRHEEQLLYVGGWTIDDGALYESSATLLTADGPNFVGRVTPADIEEGGVRFKQGDDTVVRKKPGRTKYGNITLGTAYDADDEYLPDGALPVCKSGDLYCYDVQSQVGIARHATGSCPGDGDVPAWAIATTLDAPVLHLMAADASNDVKFKAGAELSKAVN